MRSKRPSCRRKVWSSSCARKRLERDRQRLVVEDLQRRVADLDIKSPVDGVVGTLVVAERANVAQNAPLLSVVDLGAFEIEFQVPESYADDLGLGMDAEITYGADKYAANVSAVSPEVKQGQVTGRLRFARVPQGLRQNQRVSTRIVLESRDDVLKVPRGPFLDAAAAASPTSCRTTSRRAARSAPAAPACPKSRSSKGSPRAIASSFQTLASSSASKRIRLD